MEPRLSFVPVLAATSALSSVSHSSPIFSCRPAVQSAPTDVLDVVVGSSSCGARSEPLQRQSVSSVSLQGSSFHGQALQRRFEFGSPSSNSVRFHVDAVATDPGIHFVERMRYHRSSKVATWTIKLLYDGECPVCLKQVAFLRERDVHSQILYEDIAADDYDPDMNGGIDYEMAMKTIHGVLPDGTVVHGMETIRLLYDAIGLGWLSGPTGWPVLKPVFDRIYDWFSENRLTITGEKMCDIECDLKL